MARRFLHLGVAAASWFAICPPARALPVRERWAGDAVPAAHAGTLRVREAEGILLLRFDLSALGAGTAIHRAWLHLDKEGGQPRDAIRIHVVEGGEDGTIRRGAPLRLEPPWYRRFEATEAVRSWVRDPAANRGIAVVPFEGLRTDRSYLEILYEGEPRDIPDQVEGLRAIHHDGQTFLVWTEHPAFRPRPEEIVWVRRFSERGDALAAGPEEGAHPAIRLRALRRLQGIGLRDRPSGFQGIRDLARVRRVEPIAYRVYRSGEPITAANIHRARILATIEPLSGYDKDVYAIHFKGEYIDQREDPESVIPTLCVRDGDADRPGKPLRPGGALGPREALRPGEALYVHTPRADGAAFYAVTAVRAGTENLAHFGPGNSLAAPLEERAATPRPILQWIQEDRYRDDPPESWYRLWAAPPYVNLPSRSFRVAVAASDRVEGPRPLRIGGISGTFNVRESIRLPDPGAVTLAFERQLPWLPALFYNEGRDTLRGKTECIVDAYCERYVLLLIRWILDRYPIDRSRVSGSLLYFGLRHPEILPRLSLGSYTATYDYRWAPGSPEHLGPEGTRTAGGEDAWAMYSVGGYVLRHPGRDIPFLVCISGTGKDRGHTSEFGWQDDPRGWAALLEARQPFVAAWSGGGDPYGFSRMFAGIRWDRTIPAFSRCSLDNNPGNGDPADGDYYGQINGYLLWENDSVDEPDRWAMTVFLVPACPRDACTVDITPRHTRRFKPEAGARFRWTNTSLGDGRIIGSGAVAADRWGRVTIEGARIGKARNRIRIARP